METILFITVFIAGLHFMYESVILPSMTLRLKYKLAKLKDEVIMMAIDENQSINKEEYNYILNNIYVASKSMKYMTISTMINAMKFFHENQDTEIDSNSMTFDKLQNERFKRIHKECTKHLFKALLLNSLMWFIYLAPLFLLVFAFGRTKKTFKKLIDDITSVNQKDFNKVVHDGEDYCMTY